MPETLTVPTTFATFDGTVDIRFVSEDGQSVKDFPGMDAALLYDDINSTLNEDERQGLKFMQGVRRYIEVKFGIMVNVFAAGDFYKSLGGVLSKAENFFTKTSESGVSTPAATHEPLPPSNDTPPSD